MEIYNNNIQTLLNYDFTEADSIFEKYITEMRPVIFMTVLALWPIAA